VHLQDTLITDGAASNKHAVTTLNTAKLDQESEELKHASLALDVAKLIQKGRQDKGFTQKDLATVCHLFLSSFCFTNLKILPENQ